MSLHRLAPVGLGLRRHHVELRPHDRAWGRVFGEVSGLITEVTDVPRTRVLHVGSTAVSGLSAKPILDVDLVLGASHDRERVVSRLEEVGFLDRGEKDGGIGRLAVWETAPGIRAIHVHILGFRSEGWRRDLGFRDALRSDAALRGRYEALKSDLARRFASDRTAYRQAKHGFIVETLQRLGLHGDSEVRRLAWDELPAYRRIRARALRTDPDAFGETIEMFEGRPEEALRAWYERYTGSGDRGILIKEVEGVATGMCGFGLTDEDRSEAFIWGMFVAPESRGQGVGRQLLTEARRLLAVLGAERLRAKVAAPDDGAVRFYRALGFRIGERVGWLREGSDVPVHTIETGVPPVAA